MRNEDENKDLALQADVTADAALDGDILSPSEGSDRTDQSSGTADEDMATKAKPKSRSRFGRRDARKVSPDISRGNPPISVVLGYIPDTSRKDAMQHAKGYAEDHLDAIENAWVALQAFRDGFIFELHEAGDGKAYLPEIVENLNTDPEMIVWFPSGSKLNRVVTVEMVNGYPYPTILTEEESTAVRASGQTALGRSGKMERLVKKGEKMLFAGVTLAVVSATALLGSVWYGIGVDQQPVSFRTYNADILPHGQIVTLSEALRDDRWVSRIVFENGQWSAEFEEIDTIILPENNEESQQMTDELMRIEAGIRERLSGNSAAEIPDLTMRGVPEQSDRPAAVPESYPDVGDLYSADSVLTPEEIDIYLVEMESDPEDFAKRLESAGFRDLIISTPRLRLAGFSDDGIRAALLDNPPTFQEED